MTADHLAWSPDGLKIAFAPRVRFRVCPQRAGRSSHLQDSGIGTSHGPAVARRRPLLFSVWRDSVYRVPSTGGTPVVHVAVNPETEIDFHGLSVLPDNRLLFATHVRKGDMDARRAFRRAATDTGHVGPDADRFSVRVRIPPVPPAHDECRPLGRAIRGQARGHGEGAPRAGRRHDVSCGQTMGRWPMRCRRRRKRHSSGPIARVTMSPVPGATIDVTLARFRSLARWPPRSCSFIGSPPIANIVVRNLDTGADTPLTFNSADAPPTLWTDIHAPRWFPGGDRVLYVTGRSESRTWSPSRQTEPARPVS